MALDYFFRWLSTAPLHRIVALWLHPFQPIEMGGNVRDMKIAKIVIWGLVVNGKTLPFRPRIMGCNKSSTNMVCS